ncbi:flavin-dependent oxidoreductase [Phaeobacter inhibens]|uniref:flavin-dependent oxidoreductase n=1 Tax=Phaeobacter inhibens TaxID=221822 RepID=UPI000C99A467|nr:flavin-dependent oxidoreductase [Phaeobacter inhibens]AUQ61092.1 2-polyprenyl-6-methoxyphenol hydroxylase [Phaeobacter inhibens]AUQ81034.1 2-polyprenyl-6-methoxyphenol hydroxylase [Phaeobacter inhibens]AUQ88722.1 2-polyprenyl-6-methoxyphenol hydroxylase [Phaeobacter inhibens]MDO6757580.1 flavin-dependent oxidoreductase [Phaeobacter inhibens]
MTVMIAGAGIAGLTLGLTLHELGVPFHIYEATETLKPMGVGINLQPNAVRELFDLGLEAELSAIGVRTRQLGFYSKLGKTIWEEPRGEAAGYRWPQFSVHRGALQMMLYHALLQRAGSSVLTTGARATGYDTSDQGVCLHLENSRTARGDLLIAADGIHSAIRAQMYPDEGAPIWNGRILWRATTRAPAFHGGAAMAMIGHDQLRLVAYPISTPEADGSATINWIAEKLFDPSAPWKRESWNRAADISNFLPDFANWHFDWIDVPALIKGAETVYEYPMVDRDPLPRWQDGPVSLMGDAAHPTYPVGSNGASQAIVDARIIGAQMLAHGINPQALSAYEAAVRPVTTAVALANRAGGGPDGVLQQVEDLCGGDFSNIGDVIPQADLAAHAAKYKSIAGFSIEELNARPRTIPAGTRIN